MVRNPLVFPVTDVEAHPDWQGMRLRDYFAGQALITQADQRQFVGDTARYCYAIADAMLAARQVTEPEIPNPKEPQP